jgi:hypothetical protein
LAEDEAAPKLLCLLLQLREQMHGMDARLERIGAHVERIDARVRRMERVGPSRSPPPGDAPGPLRVAVRARVVHLLDLPAELLVAIASQLAEDDELALALACHRLCMRSRPPSGERATRGCRRVSARRSARWSSWSGPGVM